MWITVPEGAILYVDNLALFHLHLDQYESNIKMSEFYSKHALELLEHTVTQVQVEGTQTIEKGPVNEVLKEIESQAKVPIQPLSYSWSSADSVITAAVGLGYLLTFFIAYCHFCHFCHFCQALKRELAATIRQKGHIDKANTSCSSGHVGEL